MTVEHPRSNDTLLGSLASGRVSPQTAAGRSVVVSRVAVHTLPHMAIGLARGRTSEVRRLTSAARLSRLIGRSKSLGSASTVRIQPGQACGFARFSSTGLGVLVNRRAAHS